MLSKWVGGTFLDKVTKPTVKIWDIVLMMREVAGVHPRCHWALYSNDLGLLSHIIHNDQLCLWWSTNVRDQEGLMHLYIQFFPDDKVHPNESPCTSACGYCRGEDSDDCSSDTDDVITGGN